MMSSFKV